MENTTASPAKPALIPAAGARSSLAFGIGVDVLLTAANTAGAYSLYRLEVPPGAGSPFHLHKNDDEAFYIVDGSFHIRVDNEILHASPGQTVFLPRNRPHYFRNAGPTTGHLLAIGNPAGHERFFHDAATLGPTPDPAAAIKVCADHGMELLPK